MSIHYYDSNEDTIKNESINNFLSIFKEYNIIIHSLKEALNEMFLSTCISSQKAYEFTEDIMLKAQKYSK